MNYSMDIDLRQMQTCQLNILKEFQKVCQANHLTFYLAFGSCLGAVRHHGFIPWDDDVDVFMRIEDIRKLVGLQDQFPPHLYIQTHEKEPEYGLLITRIRNSLTTLIEIDHCDRDINQGVYIDIYPLYYYGGSWIHRRAQLVCSFVSRLFTYNRAPMNKGIFPTVVSRILLNIFPRSIKEFIAKKTFSFLTSYHSAEYIATIPDLSDGRYYPSEVFGEPLMCQFEDVVLPIPTKPDEFLRRRYGEYMLLPPEEQRIIHHNYVFVDLNNSYLKYRGIKYLQKI